MLLAYILLVTAQLVCIRGACDPDYLQTIEWTGGPFEWTEKSVRALFKSSGKYISKNIVAQRAQIYGDYCYLALTRLRPGVPATLAQVSLKSTGSDAILTPFPCWLSQEEKNCKALQSVVDLFCDTQGVLWALDSGVVNTLHTNSTPIRYCPPKVVAFSLKTGKLLKTVDLSGLVTQTSRLQYVACEYPRGNQRPVIYVSDAAARSILVYDVVASRGYRVVLPQVVANGCNRRDILYMALVRKGCGNNYIIFTYLCGKRIFSIRTDYLRTGSANGRIVDLGLKPNKLVILGTDTGSAVFFRYEGKQEIYRWDSNTCFKQENFLVVYKASACFLPTQVMADHNQQRMRVLQSNFPDYVQHTVGCGAVQQIHLMEGTC
ncbi:hypothetical protein PPYR_13206 [Photinus pyralis]|uniref:Bee-milk protein n=1 Tax=Photinus pyralis TaxID=7054 RepID=A0A5N4A8C5_PHOPY|nr:uncharacterized protein LOC116177616 [Photinus pyralis]KAB0793586.1 hypothetical protein PPYR_13206 [Photinus pyralis]